jgi:hypothetical protein
MLANNGGLSALAWSTPAFEKPPPHQSFMTGHLHLIIPDHSIITTAMLPPDPENTVSAGGAVCVLKSTPYPM